MNCFEFAAFDRRVVPSALKLAAISLLRVRAYSCPNCSCCYSVASKPVSAGTNPVVKFYLLLFNLISAGGWGLMLAQLIKHLAIDKKPVSELHTTIWTSLFISQTLALLELVHSLLGLVRSPFFSSLVCLSAVASACSCPARGRCSQMQVSSRILLTWGVVWIIPESRTVFSFAQMTLVRR